MDVQQISQTCIIVLHQLIHIIVGSCDYGQGLKVLPEDFHVDVFDFPISYCVIFHFWLVYVALKYKWHVIRDDRDMSVNITNEVFIHPCYDKVQCMAMLMGWSVDMLI